MSRHETDSVSLMGGLLLVLVAGLYLLHDLTTVQVDGRWVGPGVLIAVGLAGLVATLRPRR
jgi:hypothetical protein